MITITPRRGQNAFARELRLHSDRLQQHRHRPAQQLIEFMGSEVLRECQQGRGQTIVGGWQKKRLKPL